MDDPQYGRVLLLSFGLASITFALVLTLQRRLTLRQWPQPHPALALLATCLFLAIFILHFGRHQFGGYDFNLVMETGWRQVLGQRPYIDFPTTTPPGFNLGIFWAYRLFGVSWDAILYLTALFACITFLWLYWLFRRLAVPSLPALTVSLAIECAANLLLSFWWYNSTTLTLAAIFFLSTLLCTRHLLDSHRLPSNLAQFSFVLSLALLALFKPNLAALIFLPGLAVLLFVASRSLRTLAHALALILAAAALTFAILTFNHISIPVLISVYRGVAGERGLTLIGFSLMQPLEKVLACLWLPVLSIPLLAVVPTLRTERNLRALAATLFLFTGPLVALYGIAANGEFRSVECTVLLAASGIAVFTPSFHNQSLTRLRRAAVAILCASIASDLYQGVIRLRVAGVGPHMFFEWSDNQNLISTGVLRNMRVSATMVEVEREVALAHAQNPGPLFFGPRVDFNYAVLGLPSPAHLPAWWQPGTAFPRVATPALLATWQSYRFPTLIFLKEDYTYYPDKFLTLINSKYTRDDTYPSLTIYHRRPAP